MDKPKVKKVMVQAINLIFEFLKNKERVEVWLYESTSMKIEGQLIGFDEYMNVVLDDAEEVYPKSGNRVPIDRILLKGDCITLINRAKPKDNSK
jgi:small nuclear ribonucleoprotein E